MDDQQLLDQDQAPVDYFGFQATETFTFPDGRQFIEFSIMNEGQKAKFQKMTSRDLIIQRNQDARMKMDPAQERHELIKSSVVGWNLYRGGNPVPFTKQNLNDFLELANPRLIEDLEKAIRKANPWLLSEMKPEDIKREIENLQEMLEVAEERERGEGSSSSK
jgi:hypothetical protein